MAVLGRVLYGSQQRVDLADMLSESSYTGADFKFLIKSLTSSPMILKGFEVVDASLSIGTAGVSIRVSDSVVYSPTSNAGSFFYGLPEGNVMSAPLVPELRVNTSNYVYLILTTTGAAQDSRAFWDVDLNGGIGGEFNQDVNTESVLKAELGVSVSTFPEGSIPLCKIDMNATSIVSITDCRNMMFRLGKGGVTPNPFYTYAWKNEPSASYSRNETPGTITNSASPSPFKGGDKNILSLKEWMDSIMTKLLEISGTTYWYETTGAVNLPSLFDDSIGSTIKSKGKWSHSGATPGLVTWSEDIIYKKVNDPRDIIIRANPTTGAQLQNEQVLYIKMVRDSEINPLDTPVIWTNSLYVNGVIGSFENIRQGDWIKKQSDDPYSYVRVEELYSGNNGTGTAGVSGLNAQSVKMSQVYAGTVETAVAVRTQGEFKFSPTPEYIVANRDDPVYSATGGDGYWLAIRSDTILSTASVVPVVFSASIDISDSDGTKAKLTFPSPHGLFDKELIVVSGAGAYNGVHSVEAATATEVYIKTVAVTNPSGVTAKWAIITTASRSNGSGYILESANHGFNTGETVVLSGISGDFNGQYVLATRSLTSFQVAYAGAEVTPAASQGLATVAKVILRTEFGSISVVQGQDVDIGGDIQNLMDFIGMTSLAQTHPDYYIPGDAGGNTLLSGSQNYNSASTDSLTVRVSRLTGMMMGRIQDRSMMLKGRCSVRNTTSGLNQNILFSSNLVLSKPGSPDQIVSLSNYDLLADQALVISLDRELSTAIVPTVESLFSPFLLAENKIVLASRFSDTSVFWMDGSEIKNSSSYTVGQLEDAQSKNITVHDSAGVRLDVSLAPPIGVFFYGSTGDVSILIPGSASNTIDTTAINALSSSARTIPDGSCVWIRINRASAKTFTNTNTSALYQDSDSAGTLYITSLASVPVDQDVVVLYINRGGALLNPWDSKPVGNVYEEDKIVVSTSPVDDNEALGPILSSSIITLPFDSRDLESIQYYVVGSGQLEVFLSGQRLRINEDWLEVGATGSLSTQIQIQQDLVVGDVLTFRIATTGAVYFTPSPPSSASLQTAYTNGNIVNINTGSPIILNGASGKLLVVNGDVEITGVIDPKGIEFTREASDPLAPGSDGIWIDAAGHMWQKRGASPSLDFTEGLLNPSSFITAGAGLGYTGSTLDVKVDATSGLTIASDEVVLVKSATGAITGDSTAGIGVNLEPSNASLEILSNQLRLKRRTDSGIVVDSGGSGINLEAVNPSLQITGNQLGVKLFGSGALVKTGNGLEIGLETVNPSLAITSNELKAKLNPSGAIVSGVNGLGLNIDSSLSISGNLLAVSNVGTILTDLTNNTGASIAPGIPVAADVVTGKFILAGAGSLGSAQRYIGITAGTIANNAVGKVQIGGYVSIPSASFVVGQPVYLDVTPGALTNTVPTASASAIFVVGVATEPTKFVMASYLIGVKGNIYEESTVLGSAISSGGNISLPVDSRDGSSAQNYRVGSGELEVLLNGQKMRVGDDYSEVGALNTFSTQIQTLQDLVIGDLVTFRVAPTQTSYSGGNLSDPMTSAGDMIYRSNANATSRLPVGTTGQVLTTTAPGTVSWANNPAGFTDPLTTAGDIIYKDSGNTTARLGIGAPGQVLTSTGPGTVAWSSPAAVSQEILLQNNTGSTLPAFTPVRADSNGDMADIDVSSEISAMAIVGITKVSVPTATTGSMVTSGRLENVIGSFVFGNVLYVSKTGGITSTKPDIGVDGFVGGDVVIKLGVVTKNQSNPALKDLIIQIQIIGIL